MIGKNFFGYVVMGCLLVSCAFFSMSCTSFSCNRSKDIFFRDKTLREWILQSEHKDPTLRDEAAQALGDIGDKICVKKLIKMLEDPYTIIRISAAQSLGKIRDRRAIKPIIRRFLLSGDTDYIDVLGNIKHKSSIPFLISLLSSKSQDIQMSAAFALGNIGSQTVPFLSKLYSKSEFFDMRSLIIFSLGKTLSRKAVPTILQGLKDEDKYVRIAALEALGEIRDSSVTLNLISYLKEAKDIDVKIATIIALGRIGDKSALSVLLNLLEKKKETRVKKKIIIALGNIGDVAASELLIRLVKSKNRTIRLESVKVLGKLRDASATGSLIQIIDDEDVNIRIAVVKALGRIENVEAIAPLFSILEKEDSDIIRGLVPWAVFKILKKNRYFIDSFFIYLKDKNQTIRLETIKILTELDSKKAVSPLIRLLDDRNNDIFPYAIDALGSIRSGIALKPLVQELKNSQEQRLKQRIFIALSKLDNNTAIPRSVLVDFFNSSNWLLRWRAGWLLSERVNSSCENKLLSEYSKKSYAMRKDAIVTLGELRCKKSIPFLKWIIENVKIPISIREEAVRSIGMIGDQSSWATLLKAIKNKEPGIRMNAFEAIGNINDKKAIFILKRGLKNNQQDVKVKCALILARKGYRYGVPILIEVLRSGLSFDDIIVGLRKVTGQNFVDNWAIWARWWEKNKDRILKEELEKDTKQ